jgi:hypothetical protein
VADATRLAEAWRNTGAAGSCQPRPGSPTTRGVRTAARIGVTEPRPATMTIHSLYIFSKRGTCLYYTEWARPRSTLRDTPDEDRKLMFGMLFSLKQLMNKMNPAPAPTPRCVPTSLPSEKARFAWLRGLPGGRAYAC